LNYQLVSEFTSFVAIEDRQQPHHSEAGAPTIQQLIEKENLDELIYMDFETLIDDVTIEDEFPLKHKLFSTEDLKKIPSEDRFLLIRLASTSERYDDVLQILNSLIEDELTCMNTRVSVD